MFSEGEPGHERHQRVAQFHQSRAGEEQQCDQEQSVAPAGRRRYVAGEQAAAAAASAARARKPPWFDQQRQVAVHSPVQTTSCRHADERGREQRREQVPARRRTWPRTQTLATAQVLVFPILVPLFFLVYTDVLALALLLWRRMGERGRSAWKPATANKSKFSLSRRAASSGSAPHARVIAATSAR